MNSIADTLEEYEWIIPYRYGSTTNIDGNNLTIEYVKGDENTDKRLKIFAKYISTTKIELTMIRSEYFTFNENESHKSD